MISIHFILDKQDDIAIFTTFRICNLDIITIIRFDPNYDKLSLALTLL